MSRWFGSRAAIDWSQQAEAVGNGAIDGTQGLEAGFGITVVPLQYVSAQTLTKLLENFAIKPGWSVPIQRAIWW